MTSEVKHAGNAEQLLMFDRAWEAVHREMLAWLAVPPGATVLDAGCGAGGMTALLSAAVGAGGALTALDIVPEVLDVARDVVSGIAGVGAVDFRQGSVLALPFAGDHFDLAWCSRVIHGLPDQLAGVRELVRVVKPGGRVALREGGFPLRMLPADTGVGEPELEGRVQAAHQRWFWEFRRSLDGSVPCPHGWTQMLRDAGCIAVAARSFTLEWLPPFTEEQIRFLDHMLRGPLDHPERSRWLDPEDRRALDRLCDRDSPDYALHRPDLHVLATTTVYVGTV